MDILETIAELDRTMQAFVRDRPDAAGRVFEQVPVDPSMVSEMFHGWWTTMRDVQRPDFPTPANAAISLSLIRKGLRKIKSLLVRPDALDLPSGRTQLLEELNRLDTLIWSLTGRRWDQNSMDERREVRRALEAARRINSSAGSIDESIAGIETAFVKARTDAEQIREDGARARALLADAEVARANLDSSLKVVGDRAADSERLHSEMLAAKDGADARKDHFEVSLNEIHAKSKLAEDYLASTVTELRATIDSLKRHGLASAFADRAAALKKERYLWIVLFVAALASLAIISVRFSNAVDTHTYEAVLAGILRRVALAAPFIWLGWYAARQVGTLSRLKEDYDYKAATALAFEGYQREVVGSGEDYLIAKLLGTAIDNFGDNPVRLYEKDGSDAASPTEELVRKILTEGGASLSDRIKSLVDRK